MAKTLSEEHKRKIGLAHKGRVIPLEQRKRQSETLKRLYREGKIIHPWIGRKHTEETKRKISMNHYDCSGSNNSAWKGGEVIIDGYVYIYAPNHPRKSKKNYVLKSVLEMEKKIGRN